MRKRSAAKRDWTGTRACCKLASCCRRQLSEPPTLGEGANNGKQHSGFAGNERATSREAPGSHHRATPRGRSGGHAQGRLVVPRRRSAQGLARRRATLPGSHHQPPGARPARRQDAAGCGENRPPRADRVSLDQPGPHLEGSRKTAGVCESTRRRGGARRRPHVLARAGPGHRARRLVRRHFAAGAVPLGRRRRELGAVLDRQ